MVEPFASTALKSSHTVSDIQAIWFRVFDMEIEDLDEEEILIASKGQLPVIFVNVTFHAEELTAADSQNGKRASN